MFAYVSDLSKHGEWAADPLQITAVDDSEIAVGKKYTSTVEFRGDTVTGGQTVTVYEPSQKFAFHVKDTTSKHDHVFTFTPQGEGTLLERTSMGQWTFGMWLLAATFGGIMIGKPAAMSPMARIICKSRLGLRSSYAKAILGFATSSGSSCSARNASVPRMLPLPIRSPKNSFRSAISSSVSSRYSLSTS